MLVEACRWNLYGHLPRLREKIKFRQSAETQDKIRSWPCGKKIPNYRSIWPRSQAVKTLDFHSSSVGSTPTEVTIYRGAKWSSIEPHKLDSGGS